MNAIGDWFGTGCRICIGVNTAMLGVLYRVVLKPLPFPDSEQLVRVQLHHQSSDQTESELSVAEFQALSTESKAFERVAAFSEEWCTLSGIGMPRRVWGIRVTSEFFETLGKDAFHGGASRRTMPIKASSRENTPAKVAATYSPIL